MSSRTITGGECFSRNDEGSCIGSKVLEEVGETIKHNKALNSSWCGGEPIISKTYQRFALVSSIKKAAHEITHGGEKNCEYAEAHKLYRLSSPRVDEKE